MTPLLSLLIAAELPKVPESEAWRKDMPSAAAPRTPVLPKFEQQTLDNGMTVFVATVNALPLASFTLVTHGGSALDPKPKAGLGALTYAMLEEGSGELDSLEFSDRVADLGASFSSGCERERGSVSIGGLKRNADAMLALLAQAVQAPKMTAKDFERLKKQTMASLARRRGSPQGLAFEFFPELIYGADHPYGHPSTGLPETVSAIGHEDVVAHHQKILGPANSALVAAGDVTLAEAVALAKKHFGGWTTPVDPPPPVPALEAQGRTKVLIVNKPGPQSMVLIGRPTFGRGHEDEAALKLINAVYGGNFSSRLNMNLREGKGYTYGASSQLSLRKGVGVFLAYSAIRADVTAPGLGEFFGELDALKSKPAEVQEIEDARAGIIRSLPGRFETTGAIASAAAQLFVDGLPLTYYDTLADKYSGVDAAAIRKAGDTWLVPGLMKVLVVGDADRIKDGVELLKLGEVEIRQPPE